MRKTLVFISFLGLFGLSVSVYAGEEPVILGQFDDWNAFSVQEEGGKACYMSSAPIKSVGKYTRRDDSFLTVTHRPHHNTFDVVSFEAGFTIRKGSKPTLKVDRKKTMTMIPVGGFAWLKEEADDKKMVADMRLGGKAVLNSQSARGTKITDTFSLKGFSRAYRAIQEACGRDK